MNAADPHAQGGCEFSGSAAEGAELGLVLAHGRGGSATDILGLAEAARVDGIAMAAPQAAGNSWWPVSFLAPQASLAPWLDSALAAVERAVSTLEAGGLARRCIVLAGFSQGACLAAEYAARSGGPWAGVAVLSGGLVGTSDAPGDPDPALYGHSPKAFDYSGRLDGVPVYLGCHAEDPHIPRARVTRSAEVLRAMGARVDASIHAGAGHGVTQADMQALRRLLTPHQAG